MFRRTAALVLLLALPHGYHSTLVRAQQSSGTGGIQGTAQSATGEILPNFTVQIRNLQTGQLAGSTTSSAAGIFSFTGLNPATYVIEIVNSAGAIVGTTSAISVTAAATVSVTVSAAVAGTIAATTTAAAAGAAIFGISTAAVVTTAATVAGIAAVVVAQGQAEASASK